MDSDSKMIHTNEFTRANIHDSDMFDHVTTGKEDYIRADKTRCQRTKLWLKSRTNN